MTFRIRIFDLETTGFTPPDHAPCEVAYCDLVTRQTDLIDRPTGWRVAGGHGYLCNPGRPIPPETSAIHHIVDEDVADLPLWLEILDHTAGDHNCGAIAYAAHNGKFERQWITDEMTSGKPWICTYKCALRLWPEAPSHSNQGLRYWRKPSGIDRAEANVAHRAYPDAYVTAHLLRNMLELASVEQLIDWSSQPALLAKIPFGDLRGQPWSAADASLLRWVLRKDFSEDVHFTARAELLKREADRNTYDEDDAA
jgi:exodeoxyribonuclease X